VEGGGFEPPKAYAGRFTVCSLWPLGYLSTHWSRWPELNWQPTDYKSVALPLSYIGPAAQPPFPRASLSLSVCRGAWRKKCLLHYGPPRVKPPFAGSRTQSALQPVRRQETLNGQPLSAP